MIKVLDVPVEQDLSELSRELWARSIGHQIRHKGDHQEIWLADPAYFPELLQMIRDWQQGNLANTQVVINRRSMLDRIGYGLRVWPLTIALLLVSALVTAGIFLETSGAIFSTMTFVPVGMQNQQLIHGSLQQVLESGELWRLISPMFLHFGILHLAFNSLWVWELGRMIEEHQKSRGLLLVVFISGLVANFAQYMVGDVLFGGLSGVVYALLGYCWFWDKFARVPRFHVRKAVFIALMIWLVFCLVGGAGVLGLGNIANAAHIGGLIAGTLLAWLRIQLVGEGAPPGQIV